MKRRRAAGDSLLTYVVHEPGHPFVTPVWACEESHGCEQPSARRPARTWEHAGIAGHLVVVSLSIVWAAPTPRVQSPATLSGLDQALERRGR